MEAMESVVSGIGQGSWNDQFWCAKAHPHGWVLCCADVCGGVYVVYRFSAALAIFFVSLALMTIGHSRFGARLHRGFWFPKVFMFLGILISMLWVPNDALQVYREVSRYCSFLFLLMQILLLIDFGYGWNEKWLNWDDKLPETNSPCTWKLAILMSTSVMYLLSLAAWIYMYITFGKHGCTAQQWIISICMGLCVAMTAVSMINRIAPHGAILTSAVVTVYCTYLTYSALTAHSDEHCNPFAHSRTSGSDLTVGLLIAGISMASTAYSATGSKQAMIGASPGSELTTTLEDANGDKIEDSATKDEETEVVEPESFWYYHLMMTACSMYMAMLLTDWSHQLADVKGVPAVPAQDADKLGIGVGPGSFWVKTASAWMCILMYSWTLLAPYMLKDIRDFGIQFDD